MKKLRLNPDEQEMIIKDIIEKFDGTGKYDISSFEYTKQDVKDFLKALSELQSVKKPMLLIDVEAYTKMYELVKQSSIELQWHMMVKRDKNNQTYTIYDILLFPQTNTGTSTTTDEKEFAEWQMKLLMDADFPIEDLRGHGHSHVNMNVYSSGIDDAYQRDLITKVEDGDYYIFLVLNKKMEMYALIYDFDQQVVFDTNDIDIQIISSRGENIRGWCKEAIETYCKTVQTYNKGTYRGYQNYLTNQSTLKIDNFVPPEEEFVLDIPKPKKFGRRKK